jgi:sensor histidine kinase regulating citrate/malate metabolism
VSDPRDREIAELRATLGLERQRLDAQYERRALTVAQSVAGMPSVRDALRDSDPSRTLQPLAEGMRRAAGANFVVIAGPDGIRYSHPNPALIGKRIDEDPSAILAGHTFVGIQQGTLGVSARGKAPIFDGTGRVVGIVSVGFADCNDPALFVGEAEGDVAVCVPLDDNVEPTLYEPLTAFLLSEAFG